jgi:iron complex outermembrane receptor protein
MKELFHQGPQVNLNQILNMVAPSFTSNTQTADGTDHIDPAQLRGLGPDQVLVLVNGKEGTPLLSKLMVLQVEEQLYRFKCYTSICYRKIEVLRDGASAQYGSDAIAGVININVKKKTNKLDVALLREAKFQKDQNKW